MDTRKRRTGRPAKPENRTRTRALMIRLSDDERAMLDELAVRLDQPNASEVFRFLVKREHAATMPRRSTKKGAR